MFRSSAVRFLSIIFSLGFLVTFSHHVLAQGFTIDHPPELGVFVYSVDAQSASLYITYNGGATQYICPVDGPFETSYAYELRELNWDVLGTSLSGTPPVGASPPFGYDGPCAAYEDWDYTSEPEVNTSSLTPGVEYTVRVRATNDRDTAPINQEDVAYAYFTIPADPATINVVSNIPTSWVIDGPEDKSAQNDSQETYSSVPAGTYTIYPDNLYCYSKAVNSATQTVSPGGTITFNITYTYNCGPSGDSSADIKANGSNGPISIYSGQSATISWTSSDVTSCSVTPGGWTGTSGSQSSGALTSPRTYVLDCLGPNGAASDSVYVGISDQPVPTVDIQFNGSNGPVNNFPDGSSGTLSWTVSNATTCTASGGTSSWNTPAGKTASNGTHSQSSGAINDSTSFTISCTGAGGTVSDGVAVNVEGEPEDLCEDPNATNYGGEAPCIYVGPTSCSISTNPAEPNNFPENNVDVTVNVLGWDGNAHLIHTDCTSNASNLTPDDCTASGYEDCQAVTSSAPLTLNNLCNFSSGATVRAHIRNLGTQARASCSVPFDFDFDYYLTNSGNLSATKGGSNVTVQNTIIKQKNGDGATQPVTITLTKANGSDGVPSGVSYSISDVTCNPTCGSVITFTVTPSAPVGTYPITVTGSPLGRTTLFNLNINSTFNYSLSNSGTSNVTKTSGNAFTQNTITKTLTAGSSQSVSLSLSGVPSGTSYSISSGTCSPTCTSVITFTVSASTPAGTYPITVTGSPLGKTTVFNLVVAGSPFSVSCSANPQAALLGQNVTWTANVSGGRSPFTYSWSGTNIPTSPAQTGNPYSKTYTTIGQKSAVVVVTDADSVQTACPPATVQINFDPDFEEF